MKRLDEDLFTEDDDAQIEQDLENAPAENISEAEVSTTEESQEEQSVSNIRNDFRGYRESMVNPSGIMMETQEMRGREPGYPGNGRMGGRPNMGQGSGRPPMEIIQGGRLWAPARNAHPWGRDQ